jgi:solute carrier family 35 protein C2
VGCSAAAPCRPPACPCRASWSLAGVVVVIASGLLLLVAGETKFDLVGFLLVMTAAMLAGLRWTITQVQLHGHKSHGEAAAP